MHPLAAHPFLSRSVGKAAVHALAAVDYTVANRLRTTRPPSSRTDTTPPSPPDSSCTRSRADDG